MYVITLKQTCTFVPVVQGTTTPHHFSSHGILLKKAIATIFVFLLKKKKPEVTVCVYLLVLFVTVFVLALHPVELSCNNTFFSPPSKQYNFMHKSRLNIIEPVLLCTVSESSLCVV